MSQNTNTNASIWLIEPGAPHPEFTKMIDLPPAPRIRGMAWTPDGSAIVLGKHDLTSDIVLLEMR
ncbi:MAG: hypothetical protein ABMA15_25485 [Vicinamibacterales bacterium]